MRRFANLGCGNRYKDGWININFTSSGLGVISHDLRSGIPLMDESVDLVYHSHLLEHFPKAEAQAFMRECYRVLAPEGVARIVVPDLEGIASEYLHNLVSARNGDPTGEAKYDWIILELIDQMVRNDAGGGMIEAVKMQLSDLARDYIEKRCGNEGKSLINYGKVLLNSAKSAPARPVLARLLSAFVQRASFAKLKEKGISLLLGKEYRALEIGRFRLRGEIHQWMYDSFSLERLLRSTGFKGIKQRQAGESYIGEWKGFCLDTEPDGSVYKPDSIYFEAVKS